MDGKFYIFAQNPVGVTDQGPFCVATADIPEGPWIKYKGNPILKPGDWGAWDDGGYSEARVRYHDGVFHCFYGGTKTLKLESIGYAYSFDGYNWIKYGANPIVPLDAVPDASGFAEVKALIEPPFIYLYHTLRYISRFRSAEGWAVEDLAIQVLSMEPHFRLAMQILSLDALAPKTGSQLEQCLPVSFDHASKLALTVECSYHAGAKGGLRVHMRSSSDGLDYDNVDVHSFEIDLMPGKTVKKTVEMSPHVRYAKIVVENPDESHEVSSVKATATVGN
ncbi:MAG: hypothetical protein GH143_01170 [Calditrichaeota bacterium]|nr:hypothetical protein [Calditrichota bacterium]